MSSAQSSSSGPNSDGLHWPPSSPSVSSSAGSKRMHSDDDGHDKSGRKKRTKREDPWGGWGRAAARVIDAFSPVNLMVHYYHQVLSGEKMYDTLSTRQKRYYESYLALQKHIPTFAAEITNKSEEELSARIKEMDHCQNSARNSDTNVIKKAIVSMVRVLYPEEVHALQDVDGEIKTNRGFKNIIFGRLLCPVNMDWANPETQSSLIATPGLCSTAAWPMFFYPKGQFDPNDLAKGLLRGELLVWVYKYIFLAPSAWHPNKHSDESKIFSTGNASLHKLYNVTPRSLAYVATHVRFALSSSEINRKNGGSFKTGDFFWHVMDYLEDPDFAEDVKGLLEWWDTQIFPENQEKSAGTNEACDSRSLMKKQAAERAKALADRTNQSTENAETSDKDVSANQEKEPTSGEQDKENQ
ncbi:hypothetical protein M422DRAFT_36807 [Sphaerobolus stellatus SS14]|uniref:Uncharacterized protein n=1 Tax=Sphaerobolus stellatus (strain SS14) TaxID=990650 RepID=A0A0C9ULW7_SPHS4|nr:hypothetical protein M422DRAFT_36807 [Sphaerobolus stellatus SS14]